LHCSTAESFGCLLHSNFHLEKSVRRLHLPLSKAVPCDQLSGNLMQASGDPGMVRALHDRELLVVYGILGWAGVLFPVLLFALY
jgi:hypothetical protein